MTMMVFVALCWTAACGDDPDDSDDDERLDGDGNECELYEDHGPFEVGIDEFELDDGTPVALFYPADDDASSTERFEYDMRDFLPEDDRELIADEDAPLFEIDAAKGAGASDEGQFPLVLFSHGLAGYRYQSSTLLAHLASWGFVVASAEHRERNLAQVLEEFAPEDDEAPQTLREVVEVIGEGDEPIFDIADVDRIAATGHSMGGNGATSMIGEPGVEAAVFYASAPGVDDTAADDTELMWQGATNDNLISANQVRSDYEDGPPPKRLVNIEDAGHLAFSDICAVGADRGGVLEIASESGMDVPQIVINLGEDGCRDDDLDFEKGWPIIHHYSVAHLRNAFGLDDEPQGLSDATTACYDDVTDIEWAAE